jgi:lipopolysaccharide transport system ATP-binding protein
MTMSEPIISIRNLGKAYRIYDSPWGRFFDVLGLGAVSRSGHRDFWALQGVDLDIRPGERVGFIGRNGAGKSTLLKLICGRGEPTTGSIAIRGQVQALLGLGVGFHPDWAGRQNIHAALALQDMSAALTRRLEEEIIDFAELEEFIDQPVKTYSAGMYTRLAFAVATCLEPEILIIDEVLGAGDAAFVSKSAARMRKLTHESGATVLFVSHSANSVIEICNRAILIEHGRIVADDDPLVVNKIYNRKVRQEEELTIRAREQRIRKRDLKMILGLDGIEDRRLMLRLAGSDSLTPRLAHKVRSIELRLDGSEVGRIVLGAQGDDEERSPNRLIAAYGMTNWGKAAKDKLGTYRMFSDHGGTYGHAPFVMSAPEGVELDRLSLAVRADCAEEEVVVDLYDGENYVPLGRLQPGEEETVLPLASAGATSAVAVPETALISGGVAPAAEAGGVGLAIGEAAQAAAVPQDAPNAASADLAVADPLSFYGSGGIEVLDITLLDDTGTDRRIFVVGESLHLRIRFRVEEEIQKFVLVVCIYLRDGRQGAQVFVASDELGPSPWRGTFELEARFAPLRLGAGEYMTSIGFFRRYDLTTEGENPAYCVLDRAVMFKVHQPSGMAKGFGAFAHAVEWWLGDRSARYDPATDHRDG